MVQFTTAPSKVLLCDYLRTGTCELSCEKEHKTIICLQQFPFEIHFQIGALALLDGYYAESTFNFSKSLERFYEFCIKLFTLESTSTENFEIAWKSIKKQSERQLGAFVLSYLNRFNECPPIFPNQKLLSGTTCGEFRNNVIHEGYLPSKDEALEYGKTTFEYIRQLAVKLQKEDTEKIQKITSLHLQKLSKTNATIHPTTMGGGGMTFLARSDLQKISFEKELEILKEIMLKQSEISKVSKT